jgi:hypothetical protein
LPQSTSSRFFIYAKLNSAVKLKIDGILQSALTIKIKRVGPFYKNSLKPNTDVSQILAGACSAIFQAITIHEYRFIEQFPEYPVDFIEYVKLTNKYERHLLINDIVFKNVKTKKLTADSTWDSLKTYIDPSGGSALTFMEGQSWTLSVEDVFNNIPLTLRVLNETPQNLKNNKIVVSQYLIKFSNTIIALITSIHIETAVIPVGYHPSIVSVDNNLEDMFPALRKAPSYLDNTIAKLEQYNAEMEAVNYTQLLNLEPSARVPAAIKILEDTCYENGILKNSTIKFVEAFNLYIITRGDLDINIPEATKLYFGLPLIDVTEFSISNNGTKILGVSRVIGDFPYGTTPISSQDLNGTYISDPPIAWQCKSSLSINGNMISNTISGGLRRYTIAGTSQDITGSVPYWVAPGGNANIDLLEYYVRVLQNQGPHLMYKITIAANIVVRQLSSFPPTENKSPTGDPITLYRRITAVCGMRSSLYYVPSIFTLLYTTNPLLKTLTRILKTIICVCGPTPADITDRITNNDTSIYTDLPALYEILITLKDFIWGRLVSDFEATPFPMYNFNLIINLKLLADDLKLTNVFSQKLPEVILAQGPVVALIINESNELLTDLPKLISILKSNDTLTFIFNEWDKYYASFVNNTKDSYIYKLVNALRTCYKNWKDNLPTALFDPLTRFANVPYTGFSYFRTYLNNAILQADDPSIDYSKDLFELYSIWIPAIVNISDLNTAGTTAQTVINNIYTKIHPKSNKLEGINIKTLTNFNNTINYIELAVSNIESLLTSEELNILNTINDTTYSKYADTRLDMLLFGQTIKKPYDIIINTINKLYNIFIFIEKIERLLYKVGIPIDTTSPVINNILTIQSLVDKPLEAIIKELQKVVDIRGVGGTITL